MKKIDIEYVASLARIRLTESEKRSFAKNLGDILAYMDKLNQLDTKTTQPTSHVLPLRNVFREDEVLPSLPQDEALSNTAHKEAGLFKVPKII